LRMSAVAVRVRPRTPGTRRSGTRVVSRHLQRRVACLPPVAQLARAAALYAEGRRFDSGGRLQSVQHAAVAQLARARSRYERGPRFDSARWLRVDVAQQAERRLAMAKVAGSKPVIRSTRWWCNWQPRGSQVPVPQGVGVRIPPGARKESEPIRDRASLLTSARPQRVRGLRLLRSPHWIMKLPGGSRRLESGRAGQLAGVRDLRDPRRHGHVAQPVRALR
jgi:hypothetical protein